MDYSHVVIIKPMFRKILLSNIIITLIAFICITLCDVLFGQANNSGLWFLYILIIILILGVINSIADYFRFTNRILYIATNGIAGPNGDNYRDELFIEKSNLDLEMTNDPKPIEKILGYRYIYSKNMDRIYCTPRYYSKKDNAILFTVIGH